MNDSTPNPGTLQAARSCTVCGSAAGAECTSLETGLSMGSLIHTFGDRHRESAGDEGDGQLAHAVTGADLKRALASARTALDLVCNATSRPQDASRRAVLLTPRQLQTIELARNEAARLLG